MKLHQVLTGACNAGDQCFAVGSVEGIPFTAYAAGSNIVILAVSFERVQIIPGICRSNVQISCLDCSTDTGKIAAAYGNHVYIYEPTPLVHHNSLHRLDYHWVQTGRVQASCFVRTLSWNLEGTRLLLGGRLLQLWHYVYSSSPDLDTEPTQPNKTAVKRSVTFELGDDHDDDHEEPKRKETENFDVHKTSKKSNSSADAKAQGWELLWETVPAQPILLLTFSPDGTLFATVGSNDTLVKVWYQDKPLLFPSKNVEHAAASSPCSADGDEARFAFVYLAHPAPVISLEWRRTSKFMPRGSVANMLMTCSADSICRLWVETILPEDGLVSLNNFDPLAAQNPRFRTQRHKHKFMQRLKHMRHCFHLKRNLKHQPEDVQKAFTIPTMPSSYSVHDYHGYGIQGTGLTVGLHFHLAATINALTDIPLVPNLSGQDGTKKDFIVHWLNNKEMHFSLQTEYMLQELSKKTKHREETLSNGHHGTEPSSQHEGLSNLDSKMRATTGDLAKFLRTNHEENVSPSDTSPRGAPVDQFLSNTASMSSLATDISGTTGAGMPLSDTLDHRIESLLKDWQQSSDLLYAVHPLDGSFLVWLVDWMDDYSPGSYRQAQVSFSSRLPNAIPVTDASTLGIHLALFNPYHAFDVRHLLHLEKPGESEVAQKPAEEVTADEESVHADETANSAGADSSSAANLDSLLPTPAPVVAMVTKHANGSLNLWHVALSDQSKFTQVLSVSHVTRISGHRFRVNHITCHPVLPLLLTTSHHNIVDNPQEREETGSSSFKKRRASGVANLGYCSELILWKVEPVGPLGKSGGITELARINSPQMSAFASVAWIPTVLPSTILGGLSNSASACFVASDGHSLRIYQAVIDARSLLSQLQSSPMDKANDFIRGGLQDRNYSLRGLGLGWQGSIRVVSEQSTSRPGCILELDAIAEAEHDWHNTQFLHVFQQQLLIGKRQTEDLHEDLEKPVTPASSSTTSGNFKRTPLSQIVASSRMSLIEASQSAVVDLQESLAFNEPFYIVVMEKNKPWDFNGSDSFPGDNLYEDGFYEDVTVMHVWKLVISFNIKEGENADFNPRHFSSPHVALTTQKMSSQRLPLPQGVSVVQATPAAGHLSSASIYPACYAPYVLTTACSDNMVRFWTCVELNEEPSKNLLKNGESTPQLRWSEWQMMSEKGNSSLSVQGSPLSISAAYSGRIAVAYKQGKSFSAQKAKNETGDQRYVNLVVVIFECESTGGSEWVREDTIHLKNVHLPHLQSVDPNVDLTYLKEDGTAWMKHKEASIENLARNFSHEDLGSVDKEGGVQEFFQGLLTVPSYATILTLKKSIEQRGNVCPLTQKHLVQLDWVSKEDGSHILTVAVGHKILLYTAVPNSSVVNLLEGSKANARPNTLTKQSSTAATVSQDDVSVRWLRLRSVQLRTADGLPPLPMHLSWVRDGIFVVGMDNEMHIYSQWKEYGYGDVCSSSGSPDSSEKAAPPVAEDEPDTNSTGHSDDVGEDGDVLDRELHTLVQESIPGRVPYVSSMAQLPRASSMHALAQAAHMSTMRKANKPEKKEKEVKPAEEEKASITQLQDYLPSYGLFEASQIACPVLPQYHPRQLMELLNSGKIRWVKAILAHLVRCVSGSQRLEHDGISDSSTDEDEDHAGPKNWSRTRTLSVSSPGDTNPVPIGAATTLAAVPEEVTLDYAEISAVPPLPLWLLLSADQGTYDAPDSEKNTDSLFCSSDSGLQDDPEDDLDAILSESLSERKKRSRSKASQQLNDQSLRKQYFYFGKRQARVLTSILTHTQLPGLSSVDQMHLLALADTLASCDSGNLGECSAFLGSNFKHDSSKAKVPIQPGSETTLDPCGLRFLLALRHHTYLLRCLPPSQRTALQNQGISSAHLVWAFHSEAHEELLQLIPALTKANPTWAEYREVGIGWWLRNTNTLRRCIEKLAKAAYQQNQDPLDAAIYYLAMKRKNIVWGLYRQQGRDERMTQFFANNFAEERWRKAALKNAYALLGKQRLKQAVAFFLLAGSLKDAIDICLSRMRDIQLAIVITRLYEGDVESVPQSLKNLLQDHVLGTEMTEKHPESSSGACYDPFMRSMAYWILGQYTESLSTLLEKRLPSPGDGRTMNIASPSVFNFYIYLRNHPLILRQQLASTVEGSNRKRPHLAGVGAISMDRNYLIRESITPLERRLYFTTAHAHLLAGCPALALEVLSKLPEVVKQWSAESENNSSQRGVSTENGSMDENSFNSSARASNNETSFDWSAPVAAKDSGFDWSAPAASNDFDWSQLSRPKEETLDLNWSDDSDEESDTSSQGGLTMKMGGKQPEVEPEPEAADTSAEEESGGVDIMAQQLKFIACLKILMGEMATLATGFEIDGGQLRLQLYVWLEKELQALKQLCNYAPGPLDGDDEEEPSLLPVIPNTNSILNNERVSLHEVLAAEKLDFEAKMKRATQRKRWLKVNELLLRTLLSYCSIHGSQGGGLASVRMELIILLQELQQDRKMSLPTSESMSQLPQQQLVTPLPFPTNLPLLAACIAGTKVITTDPVRHIQSQVRDILQTIISLREVPVPGRVSFGQICLLRDLALGLSACLYQCLCTSDAWSLQQREQEHNSANPLARLAVVFRAIHTMSGIKNYSTAEDSNLKPTSPPSKWPGVSSLRALLAREKDEDSPRLLTLLCEVFVTVYTSLLSYALAASDAHVLYRLAGLEPCEEMWGAFFGGGTKQLVRVAAASSPLQQYTAPETLNAAQSATAAVDVTKQRVRLHMKLLQQGGSPAAVGGGIASGSPPGGPAGVARKMSVTSGEDLPTYKEVFVAPKLSIVAYLMKKPKLASDMTDYDSSASDSEDEYDDDSANEEDDHYEDEKKSTRGGLGSFKRKVNTEHTNPNSISWCAIRLAATRLACSHIEEFFRVVGIEPQDLPVTSPLSHSVQRTLQQWSGWLQKQLNAAGPVQNDYIPGCYIDSSVTGPPIQKYRCLLDPSNTPFPSCKAALPLQRLWSFLVRQEEVQDLFIRLVFKKRRPNQQIKNPVRGSVPGDSVSVYSDSATHVDDLTDSVTAISGGLAEKLQDPVRIIHKDQDIISAFCINSTNMGIMALSNGKEIQELDITPLLEESPSFAEDECELDLLGLDKDLETMSSPSYLVVQAPGDRNLLSQLNQNGTGLTSSSSHVHFPSYAPAAAHSSVPPGGPVLPVTGRGTTLPKGLTFPGSQHPQFCQLVIRRTKLLITPLRKHKVEGARRMASHPTLPLYMSGENDGSVCVWEWGHVGIVSQPRTAGTYAKVNRLRFNSQGNKFGVADADGHVALWTLRLGGGAQAQRPFFSLQCHNKGTSDFVFAGSSSLIASAGHSSEAKNVALWDTLMPQRKALVHGFTCHESGSTSLVYAPQHQVFISAGRKGDVCIWDVRQRTLRHKFTAHESSVAVKCMAVDPNEEFFVTGSADGDIKVWSLATQHILFAFPAEHSRSSFFRSMSQGNGVSQLHVDAAGRMFSCGADGSIKLRQLPIAGRDSVVSTFY